MTRRQFAASCLAFASAPLRAAPPKCEIGHRQANIIRKPGPEVFELARRIPGLSGVELQVQFQGTSLWDRETMLAYRRGAENAGLRIPSLAGVWEKGANLLQPGPAEETIRKSIRTAEALGARVILVAAFEKNCPDMNDEASYGPVVEMLRKVAPAASDAGVTVGLETSLSPKDDARLIDLIARPSVKVYYDAFNVERYEHKGESVPGYETLGKPRLAQLHLKNDQRLLEEPGPVDWKAALEAIRRVGYSGWLVFETSHTGPEQCIEATVTNIALIRRILG